MLLDFLVTSVTSPQKGKGFGVFFTDNLRFVSSFGYIYIFFTRMCQAVYYTFGVYYLIQFFWEFIKD